VDSEQREEFERAYWDRLEREKLELARAKLSPEQQARVDSHAERLREQEIYAPKHETAIAQIIYGDRSHAQEHNDIDSVYSLADYEARDRGAKERLTARMLASREAANARSEQQPPELASSQQQELEKAAAQQLLNNAKELAQKGDSAAVSWVAQAETLDRRRHQSGRYDELPNHQSNNDPPHPRAPDPEIQTAEAWYLNYTKEFAAKGDPGALHWLEMHGHTPPIEPAPQPAVVAKSDAHPLGTEWRDVAHEILDRKPPGGGGGSPSPIKQMELEAEKAEKQRAAREHDAEKLRQQEAEKQAAVQKEQEAQKLASREAKRNEPIPGTVQRFKAILAASKAQKESQPHVASNGRDVVSKYGQEPSANQRLEKSESRGEISDAKAERIAKMFNRVSSDKDFDPTHDPNNSRNFSNGRGGRGGR